MSDTQTTGAVSDKASKDMTQGSPVLLIIKFAIPLMIGDVCQQLYNMVDSIVVGRFVGKSALAALGVANPIMSIVLFLFVGICMGTAIIFSQLYGAQEYDQLKRCVSTALISGLIFTAVVCAICFFLSRWLLIISNTPADILPQAESYLKIIFVGMIFTFLYNFYSFALRAIGNTVIPLIFLLLASVLNVILDLLFVAGFQMGVQGAAIATVIAQALSSILCVLYSYIKVPLMRVKIKELIFDFILFKEIASYSFACALQQVYIYIGRCLVQGLVNSYGTDAIAAFNSASRIDALLQTPNADFVNALVTYTAQNYGAHREQRVRAGYRSGILIIPLTLLMVMPLGTLGAKWLMGWFVDPAETAIIAMGARCLTLTALAYPFTCIINHCQGIFRGVGLLRMAVFSSLISITLRVVLAYGFSPVIGIDAVFFAAPVSWLFAMLFCLFWTRRFFKQYHVS
ncbi:MATE family efflux transporter [Youxingia wuxianensis]|uniref:Probable multidrug resistance protein NorM n=1 Tax=Youxingia wuxianensis TaxID=2763678 RepID=A0A926EQ46_9FIRM|nr:MATE family efflux transporter [Youxingia wuxianensis]MBC8584617.1 MATE family efflux transporter [Youxingia wuxianensis]